MWIFSANTSPSAPPNTVKSWEKTKTLRPSMVPQPGDDTVGVGPLLEPAVEGPVAGEHVELVERALVEQVLDALAGEQLALRVLALDGPLGAGVEGFFLALRQLRESLVHGMFRHGAPL